MSANDRVIQAVLETFSVLTDLIEQQAKAIEQLADLAENPSQVTSEALEQARAIVVKTKQGVAEIRQILGRPA